MISFIRKNSPNVPISPDGIIQTGILCEKVDAFVVHIHFSNPAAGTPSAGLHIFKEINLIQQPLHCDFVMGEEGAIPVILINS